MQCICSHAVLLACLTMIDNMELQEHSWPRISRIDVTQHRRAFLIYMHTYVSTSTEVASGGFA